MIAAPRARSGRRVSVPLAVVLLITFHVAWQIWLVAAAPFPAHYDYDEGVYAQTAASAAAGHRLYSSVFLSQPPLLIGVLARAFDVFGRSLASARGVTVMFSVVWLASLAGIARHVAGRRAAVWAIAIPVAAPAFVMASHTVQMEGPSESLAALALALGLWARAAARRDAWRWAAAGAATGLCAMTKFTGAICLLPLAMTMAAGDTRPSLGDTGRRVTAVAAGGLLAAAATLAWTVTPPTALWRQAVVFHAAVARVIIGDPGRTASLLWAFAQTNWFLATIGLVGLACVAGRATRASDGMAVPFQPAIVVWLLADLAAIVLWRPVWPHHLVILVTPLAVLGAVAVERGVGAFARTMTHESLPANVVLPRARLRLAMAALAAAWFLAWTTTAASTGPEASASLRAAAGATARAVPSGRWVVADDPLIPFLAGRDVPPDVCDTSEMRLRSGWLTAGALIAASQDARVRGVVLQRGTFARFAPDFVRDASTGFPDRRTAGGAEILTR